MAPQPFESNSGSDKAVSQNLSIEAARPEIRDDNALQVNEGLQGADNAQMINAFMDNLAHADRNDLNKLFNGDSDFNRYRQTLESSVFGKDGKVMSSASDTDIQKLQDVNNAMIAALGKRSAAASTALKGAATMESYSV
jgi:hypothetical protein